MAYPTYTGYNPVYQSPFNQPSAYPQPQFASMQATQQPIKNTMSRAGFSDVIYATEKEAESQIVDPNNKVAFFITDKPMVIFKSADMSGFSTTEKFKMEKITEGDTEREIIQPDMKEYVKQEDLDKLVDDKLKILAGNVSKQLEEIKKSIKIQEILIENKEQ